MLRRLLTTMDTVRRNSLRQNLIQVYPFGGPERLQVPLGKVDWNVEWNDYDPPSFTIPGILKGDKPWADPEIGVNFTPRWNEVEESGLDRRSYEGSYLVEDGYPLNPVGRTGLKGRGSLGKWGPNHAADCIVTRWKVDGGGNMVVASDEDLPVLQFVAIRRQDSGEVAIPGGMIDPGETPLQASQREFMEEVVGVQEGKGWDSIEDPSLKEDLKTIFNEHIVVDKTYVDDRRNTDNAWIETCAINFHISTTLSIFNKMKFKSGSDAKEAFWIDYEPSMKLYASHTVLMKKAVTLLYDKWKLSQ